MKRIERAAPSPALAVAVLALLAGLAGTAVAESGPEARGAIKKKQVKKIAKKQAKKQAQKQVSQILPISSEDLGDGVVSGSKLGSIEQVSKTATIAGPTAIGTATATCPAGSKVIGGGFDSGSSLPSPPGSLATPVLSKREGNGWRVDGFVAGMYAASWTTYAYCLDSNGG